MVNTIADPSVKYRHLNTKIRFDESAVEKTGLEEQLTQREPLRGVPKEAKGSNIASNEPCEQEDSGRANFESSGRNVTELQERNSSTECKHIPSGGSDE